MVSPEQLAAVFAGEVEEQAKADEAFRKQQSEMNARIQSAFAEQLQAKKAPQLSPDLQEIVQILQMNPVIIPHVKNQVVELLGRIQAAIQKELDEQSP